MKNMIFMAALMSMAGISMAADVEAQQNGQAAFNREEYRQFTVTVAETDGSGAKKLLFSSEVAARKGENTQFNVGKVQLNGAQPGTGLHVGGAISWK